MCGLVGIFDSRGRREIDGSLLRRMNDRISHRGPDGDGRHLGPGIGLGHRRLAIIDLGGGHQPMYNEDGQVAVVFNGEIYNYKDLVQELEASGHVFRSHCDTEVIVHAWEEWGPECVARFRGMFAFALWDEGRETLFLARDHLGKKPLYWSVLSDGRVLFGSELKALMVVPELPRDLDIQAVEEFFAYGYVPDPRSIFSSVRKLPAAHCLVWRRGEAAPRVEAYWDVRFEPSGPIGMEAAAAELTARLREATELRMMSDVPLGAFLSGGVDSSAIVALMAGLTADPVKTFSIGFDHAAFDESDYAARHARRYGTDHHTRKVDPDDFDLVRRLGAIYDEPFGDSSAMPTFRVCQLARERVTVALSGDGGDEVFGGYRRYAMHIRAERLRASLPLALRRTVFGTLGALYPKADWAPRWMRAKTTFQELATDGARAYFGVVSALSPEIRRRLFTDAFRRDLQGYGAEEVLLHHMNKADTDDMLAKIQYADLKTWLSGGILVKVDRASMANSLEVRAPLLDYPLVEWGVNLSAGLKIAGQEGKAVLKRAAEPLVDGDLLYRPKRGFSMPLAAWFRGPLKGRLENLAASRHLADSGLFSMRAISALADEHVSGKSDHSTALWLLMMFDAFLDNAAAPDDSMGGEVAQNQTGDVPQAILDRHDAIPH